jgi:hypothetical protein
MPVEEEVARLVVAVDEAEALVAEGAMVSSAWAC